VPDAVRAMPLPRDVLGRARRVEREICESAEVKLEILGANTDPLLAPDLGWSTTPYTAALEVTFKTAAPALGRAAGEIARFTHLDFVSVQRPALDALTLQLTAEAATQARFSMVQLQSNGALHLGDATSGLDVAGLTCRSELLYSTPQDYLRSLL
jgi:hypothetical protein